MTRPPTRAAGLVLAALATMTGCSSGASTRITVPYAVMGGRTYAFGGENQLLGDDPAPGATPNPAIELAIGDVLRVHAPARGSWPQATSANPAVLAKVGDDGLGVFRAEATGTTALRMNVAPAHCYVQPPPSGGCVVATVVVGAVTATTATQNTTRPTTSNLLIP